MRSLFVIAGAVAFGLVATGALAEPSKCEITFTADQKVVAGFDDPDIPNCVVNPNGAYEDGQCERVVMWTNFGSPIADANCIVP